MRRFLLSLLFLLAGAVPAGAQIVATTPGGVVVAHDGVVELFDQSGRTIWSAPGLDSATRIAVADDRIAIVDAWHDRARIVSLHDGTGPTISAPATPVDALFHGRDLFVLGRDSRTLERIGADGTRTVTDVAADPAFLRESAGMLYVYSRTPGLLQEIDPRGVLRRTLPIASFAADMQVDGRTAYFVYPGEAKLVAIDLEKMELQRSVPAGGAPTALALVRRGNAVTAPQLAVADPSAKRLWITEGAQSFGAAFARGFMRGLLGLGIFRPTSADFPTGVDRVVSTGGVTLAFDSASGTLYRSDRGRAQIIAEGIGPKAFTIDRGLVAIWMEGRLRYLR